MKVLVTMKRIPDPEQKLTLSGQKLDTTKANWQINQFDEYALEAALRLTENAADPTVRLGEVVVLSIGPQEMTQQLRTALAMGADRAILVKAASELTLDGHTIAQIIEAVVKKESPDLILMGKLSADTEGNEVGQRLAAYLNWPQATFASSINLHSQRKSMLVGREVDLGTEYKKVPLPAVITVDLRIISPHAVQNGVTLESFSYPEGARYASLKGIMNAKKKTLEEVPLETLGVQASGWVTYPKAELPPPRKAGVVVQSVAELVDKLKHEAKVI